MADRDKANHEPRQQLFDQLDKIRAGMLGVQGSTAHMQPMTHFADRDAGKLWFVTSAQTDLVRDVGQGATAHYCLVGADQTYHACLRGPITQSSDTAKLDELWNSAIAAWFEGGRDDQDICLLEMPLRDAAIWVSTDSAVVMGLEMAKAAISKDRTPDVGEHMVINFSGAG